MKKYGKNIADVLSVNHYIENNDQHKLAVNQIDHIYIYMDKRKTCKICGTKLENEFALKRYNIQYFLCSCCGHLNGEFEDNDKFAEKVYVNSDKQEKEYAFKFLEEDIKRYNERVEKIYMPKAQFLKDTLINENNNIKIVDFGCGAGHLIKSFMNLGYKNVKGYEVSESQVKYANLINNSTVFSYYHIENTIKLIQDISADVICLIGVLEHLTQPINVIEAIKANNNIKYVYFSVPLFSLASLLQTIFPYCYERQLAGTHTHLFTKESIEYLCKKFHFTVVGEWWFGTDFADLYRGMLVNSSKNENYKINEIYSKKYLLNVLDELQLILDKNKICSEVHMIVKNN